MTTRAKIMGSMLTGIFFISLTVSLFYYTSEKRKDLKNIDEKLLRWAQYSRKTLPEDYHDGIVDGTSVTEEEYNEIVEKNNKRCRVMGLQYLWSVLVTEPGVVRFTTATSPGYDLRYADHAKFFDIHADPEAFMPALDEMRPKFTSFHNEWGHGRMVLVPGMDSHGRVFMFGASVDIEKILAGQKRAGLVALAISLAVLALGLLYSKILADVISKPLATVSAAAHEITAGNYEIGIDVRGGSDMRSLAGDINTMASSIKRNIEAVRENRKRLEELVEKRTGELKLAHERIVKIEKMAALGKLAAIIGHELRNTLGVISNSVYFVKQRLSGILNDEKVDKHLRVISEEVGISNRIITDILAYGGLREPERTEIDLNGTIMALADRIDLPGGVAIELDLAEDLPRINADKVQLSQLFRNIISNSTAAMPGGGKITVSTASDKSNIEINIKDTGTGIRREDLSRIFDPGFSSRAHGEGTGLGLAICRSIVELHGGEISAFSEEGRGATITVILPAGKKI